MAQGNGLDTEGAASAVHSLPTTFKIGGKDVRVPALTLWTLEARDAEMNSLGSGATVRVYSNTVLQIIATSIEADKAGEERDPEPEAIEATFNRFRRRITFGEMRELGASMDQLLLNSGYTLAGEAEAATTEASPGTGTLTESPQTSPGGESVEGTQKESSVH